MGEEGAWVEENRSLSEREREVLDFMLGVDDPRLEPLRRQASTATVSGHCGCGCPTIGLTVDRTQARPAHGLGHAAVDARRRGAYGAPDYCELILFVRDGLLSSLELVCYERPIPEFPSKEDFEAPEVATRGRGQRPSSRTGGVP